MNKSGFQEGGRKTAIPGQRLVGPGAAQGNKNGPADGPENLVALALRQEAAGLSWTFNEPVLWLEYILDTAPLAREAGLFTNEYRRLANL